MTCIVGLCYDGNRVLIGGDSAGVDEYEVTLRRDPKVFVRGQFAVGYTTSFRMGQLLRFQLPDIEHPAGMDPEEFMSVRFADAARKLFTAGGYGKTEYGVERGGDFLVGYRGRLFRVASDYQIAESLDPFAALGCGFAYALGSLATAPDQWTPHSRVQAALSLAAHFSAGVRAPFSFAEAPIA